MSDLDEQIRTIRDRIAAAQRARARAEHERDTATAAADRAAEALRTEFGVTTTAQARHTLADLQQALTDELATITAELDQIGA
jgi:predicted  nucleic acid-binding Zn-ribbon protein